MGKSSKSQVIGYKYYLGLHLVICRSADYINKIIYGEREAFTSRITASTNGTKSTISIDKPNLFGGEKKQGGIVGTFDIEWGNSSAQTQNDYLVSKLGADVPAYKYCTSVIARQAYMTAISPSIHPMWFSVTRYRASEGNSSGNTWSIGSSVEDNGANPAYVIQECLTNKEWGMGYDWDFIDIASFNSAASTLTSEGFYINLKWTKTQAIEDFIGMVQDHIDSSLYISPTTGKFTLKLIRQDYNIEDLTLYNEDSIIEVEQYKVKGVAELVNEIIIEYTDNERYGELSSVTVQDIASMQTQGGRISAKKQYIGITDYDLAARVGMRELTAMSSPLSTIKFKISRLGWDFNIGDVILISYEDYGIEAKPYRLTEIDFGEYGAEEIVVSAIEDAFTLEAGSYIVKQPSLFVSPNTEPRQSTQDEYTMRPLSYWDLSRLYSTAEIEEFTNNQAFVDVLANQADVGDLLRMECYVDSYGNYSNPDSNDYKIYTFPCPFGDLSEDINNYQTTFYVDPATASRLSQVETGGEQYAWIGLEKIAILGVTPTSGYLSVWRGVDNTVPLAHPAGERIWFSTARPMNYMETPTQIYGTGTWYSHAQPVTTLGTINPSTSYYNTHSYTMVRDFRHNSPLPPKHMQLARSTTYYEPTHSAYRGYANQGTLASYTGCIFFGTRNKTVEIGSLSTFYTSGGQTQEDTESVYWKIQFDYSNSFTVNEEKAAPSTSHWYSYVNLKTDFTTERISARFYLVPKSTVDSYEVKEYYVGQMYNENDGDPLLDADIYWSRWVVYPNHTITDSNARGYEITQNPSTTTNDKTVISGYRGGVAVPYSTYWTSDGSLLPSIGNSHSVLLWVRPVSLTSQTLAIYSRVNDTNTDSDIAIRFYWDGANHYLQWELGGQTYTDTAPVVDGEYYSVGFTFRRRANHAFIIKDGWFIGELENINLSSCANGNIGVSTELTTNTNPTNTYTNLRVDRVAQWHSELSLADVVSDYEWYWDDRYSPRFAGRETLSIAVVYGSDQTLSQAQSYMINSRNQFTPARNWLDPATNWTWIPDDQTITGTYDVIWARNTNPANLSTLAPQLETYMQAGTGLILCMGRYGQSGTDLAWLGSELNICGNINQGFNSQAGYNYWYQANPSHLDINRWFTTSSGTIGTFAYYAYGVGAIPEANVNGGDIAMKAINQENSPNIQQDDAYIVTYEAGHPRLNGDTNLPVRVVLDGMSCNSYYQGISTPVQYMVEEFIPYVSGIQADLPDTFAEYDSGSQASLSTANVVFICNDGFDPQDEYLAQARFITNALEAKGLNYENITYQGIDDAIPAGTDLIVLFYLGTEISAARKQVMIDLWELGIPIFAYCNSTHDHLYAMGISTGAISYSSGGYNTHVVWDDQYDIMSTYYPEVDGETNLTLNWDDAQNYTLQYQYQTGTVYGDILHSGYAQQYKIAGVIGQGDVYNAEGDLAPAKFAWVTESTHNTRPEMPFDGNFEHILMAWLLEP